MNAPKFSIVVPTRNRRHMVARALSSALAQTSDDFEIIVVDDGSTDGTRELLESEPYRACRVLRNEEGGGVSAARNKGVAAASGTYITFLDDDDELRSNALTALDEKCAEFPQVDFLWGARLIHEKDRAGREVASRRDDWPEAKTPICGSEFLPYTLKIAANAAFTIRRRVFTTLGGFDTSFRVSEDRDLFISLARGGYCGVYVPTTIIDVNENVSSLSRSDGLSVGAAVDLRVMDKHRDYLRRPEHFAFETTYLLNVFAGYLQAGNRRGAREVLGELLQREARYPTVLRKYLRHAPEFRALKTLLRYDWLRGIAHRRLRRAG